MVIKFCGQETSCTKAMKGSDWIQAYNGDILVLEIKKLADMSLVELEGGEWTEPEPSTEEVLLEIAADHEERLCMMELGI